MSTLKVNKLRDTAGSADAITLDPNGCAVLAGVTTVSAIKVGSGVTISSDGDVFHTGVCTATSFSGSGANITGISTSATSDYVKLQAATGTSAVSDLTFDTLDVTTYRTFKFVFSGYPVTDGAELFFRFRASGADKSVSAYNWGNLGVSGAGSMYDNASEETKAMICYNAGNNNYEGWRFEATIIPHVSGDPTYQNNFGFSSCARYTSSNSFRGEDFWFKYHQSDTTDGFKIYPSSGNIAAYSYTLYGLKR